MAQDRRGDALVYFCSAGSDLSSAVLYWRLDMESTDMSERMENAIDLAEKCWAKAYKTEPAFVERYLELAEQLLVSKPVVLGDEFREHCANNKLRRPASLHPNVWVSGVRALKLMGWVAHDGYMIPTKSHNHMPSVSKWRSCLFGSSSGGQA